MLELIFLFAAGFAGGIVNSLAGGGSFITFPALLFVGVPPISANATNTFASCAGYISGAYALREQLNQHKKALPWLIATALLGGITGAWLLLRTPDVVFQEAIPWLLLFATLLFIYGGKINSRIKQFASHHKHAPVFGQLLLLCVLLGVCVYGGFF